MAATASDWHMLTDPKTPHDLAVRQAGEMGTPKDWMRRSAAELVSGGAMIGANFERKFIAELIRNRVLLAEHPDEVVDLMKRFSELNRLIGLMDQMMLDMAQAIEDGTYL